jgi:hypothetical protein
LEEFRSVGRWKGLIWVLCEYYLENRRNFWVERVSYVHLIVPKMIDFLPLFHDELNLVANDLLTMLGTHYRLWTRSRRRLVIRPDLMPQHTSASSVNKISSDIDGQNTNELSSSVLFAGLSLSTKSSSSALS